MKPDLFELSEDGAEILMNVNGRNVKITGVIEQGNDTILKGEELKDTGKGLESTGRQVYIASGNTSVACSIINQCSLNSGDIILNSI